MLTLLNMGSTDGSASTKVILMRFAISTPHKISGGEAVVSNEMDLETKLKDRRPGSPVIVNSVIQLDVRVLRSVHAAQPQTQHLLSVQHIVHVGLRRLHYLLDHHRPARRNQLEPIRLAI